MEYLLKAFRVERQSQGMSHGLIRGNLDVRTCERVRVKHLHPALSSRRCKTPAKLLTGVIHKCFWGNELSPDLKLSQTCSQVLCKSCHELVGGLVGLAVADQKR
jgi:hypothetical protein